MATSVLTKSYHVDLAENVVNDIYAKRSRLYYFLGKVQAHNTDDEPDDIIDSDVQRKKIRDDIIAFKRINSNDVALCIPRINWLINTLYDMYDSTVSMEGKKFYVLTDEFNVYKCIDNANGGLSSVKPTGTSINMLRTSDGYTWKYMYSIQDTLRTKFLSPAFMPCIRALYEEFYGAGGLSDVLINSGGTGYQNNPVVTLDVNGDGTGAVLLPVIDPDTGGIVKVIVKNGGTGYTNATIAVIDTNDTPGTGFEYIISFKEGSIHKVFVVEPGSGYADDLRTTIEIQGDGTGARAIPFIQDGVITDVFITNPGSGYTVIDIDVVGSGTGADLSGIIDLSSINSDQAIIEQTAIFGAIDAVKIVNGGTGYTQAIITVDGDGTGFNATALVESGIIKRINIINPGKDYTYANIIVSGTGTGASIIPIISPGLGHGSNPIHELGASTVCYYSNINQQAYNDIRLTNEFRTYGIVEDPKEFFTSKLLITDGVSTMYKITMNTTDLQKDDVLFINGFEFTIVEIAISGVLLSGNVNFILQAGDKIQSNSFVGERSIDQVIALPQGDKYSGKLFYINTESGISLSEEQLITLQTYVTL